eukprot:364924-Amphidinium_carterae.1
MVPLAPLAHENSCKAEVCFWNSSCLDPHHLDVMTVTLTLVLIPASSKQASSVPRPPCWRASWSKTRLVLRHTTSWVESTLNRDATRIHASHALASVLGTTHMWRIGMSACKET